MPVQANDLQPAHCERLFAFFCQHIPDASLAPWLGKLPIFPTLLAGTRASSSGRSCTVATAEAVVGSLQGVPEQVQVWPAAPVFLLLGCCVQRGVSLGAVWRAHAVCGSHKVSVMACEGQSESYAW